MIFFMAAANVLETCEQDLATYLKILSLSGFVVSVIVIIFQGCVAWTNDRQGFKASEMCVHLLGACINIGFFAASCYFYTSTTDENCYDPDPEVPHDHPIDP